MITINVDKLVGGNIVITTSSSGGGEGEGSGGYDVTFVGESYSVSSGDYAGSIPYWDSSGADNILVYFADGNYRNLNGEDFGSTLHNVIGFSNWGSSSSWYWVDSISNPIPYIYDDSGDIVDGGLFRLTGNAEIYAIGV